jgi:hypothetical protein
MLFASLVLGAAAALVSPVNGTVSDIAAAGPNGPLKGTITGDAGAVGTVVLILPGSGPTDRNGDSPLGIKAATYRLLAEGLAQNGIVSVRIDKRGLLASAAAVPDGNAVTLGDYVTDTKSWIAAIRQRTGARCVWLLGHSEGGLVALATAASGAEHICGLVLVSTPGRPLGVVLKEQLRANPANAPILDAANRAIDTLSAGQRVDAASLPQPLATKLFRPQIQGFLISEIAVDPAVLIAKASKPVLVLQGQKDLQVSVADAHRLVAADPSATLMLLPETNHVLKQVASDDRQANFATYADPNLPLAPNVVETVVHFIEQQGK